MTLDRSTVMAALPKRKGYWVKCSDPSHVRKERKIRSGIGTYCQTCANAFTRTRRRKPGPMTMRKLYGYMTSLANASRTVRRVSCSMTFEEFCAVRTGPCAYCGGPLPPRGVGLDRVDARRGYDSDNVVPACARCNHARGAFITFDEFMLIMRNRRERMGVGADLWSEHEDRGGLVRARRPQWP